MCTYICTCMHYVCEFFSHIDTNKPLTYFDFFTFSAWEHNLSHVQIETEEVLAFFHSVTLSFCHTIQANPHHAPSKIQHASLPS